MKTIKSSQLRTVNRELLSAECVVPVFVHMDYLLFWAWFVKVENFAVDVVLGTLFIDCSLRGRFPSKREVVQWHSGPVAFISTWQGANAITIDT